MTRQEAIEELAKGMARRWTYSGARLNAWLQDAIMETGLWNEPGTLWEGAFSQVVETWAGMSPSLKIKLAIEE